MIKGADVTIKRMVVGGLEIKNGEILSLDSKNIKIWCYEDNREISYTCASFLEMVEKGNIIADKEVVLAIQDGNKVDLPKTNPTDKSELLSSPKPSEISNGKYDFDGPLKRSFFNSYGTNTKKIFERCCDIFDWDYDDVKYFGRETPCFSVMSTPERYDVWMLAHNNWTETSSQKWINEIYKTAIVQWSIQRGNPEKRERVVFAKTQNQQYIFLGIYILDSKERFDTDEGAIYKETYLIKSTEYSQ